MLDRVSAYGTKAVTSDDDWVADPQSFPLTVTVQDEEGEATETSIGIRVYDPGASLRIYRVDGATVYEGTASAEINATGRVVYGYNLRVPEAGRYVIEYTFPNVTVSAKNAGTVDAMGHVVSLEIDVPGSGTGGGGHRH